MSSSIRKLQFLERALLVGGLALLTFFALAHIHRFVMVRVEMAQFEARRTRTLESAAPSKPLPAEQLETRNVDTALWSSRRVKLYQAAAHEPLEPVAVLRIARLNLEVPVLEGTDELTLNRGVGRIESTSRPGHGGNIGIAGHRDSFFRGLKDIKAGDTIDLATTSGTSVYVVERVRVTDRTDLSVLEPREKPSLTLVTCYPFYYVGPAPRRYVVEASLKQ